MVRKVFRDKEVDIVKLTLSSEASSGYGLQFLNIKRLILGEKT